MSINYDIMRKNKIDTMCEQLERSTHSSSHLSYSILYLNFTLTIDNHLHVPTS